MPTPVSTYEPFSVGALTGTATADAACITSAEVLLQDYRGGAWYRSECPGPDFGRWECHPSSSRISELVSSNLRATTSVRNRLMYYEGSVCPEPWTTVGVAVKNAEGRVSSTGIFAPIATPLADDVVPYQGPLPNFLMQALSPEETAIACCPSGYDADPNGWCVEHLPRSAYTASTICEVGRLGRNPEQIETTMWYYGTVRTVRAISFSVEPGVEQTWSTQTWTVDVPQSADMGAVHVLDMVTLVHGGAAATSSGDEDRPTESPGDGAGSAEETEEPSSATRRDAHGVGKAALAVMGVWTVAALAGAGLVAAM